MMTTKFLFAFLVAVAAMVAVAAKDVLNLRGSDLDPHSQESGERSLQPMSCCSGLAIIIGGLTPEPNFVCFALFYEGCSSCCDRCEHGSTYWFWEAKSKCNEAP